MRLLTFYTIFATACSASPLAAVPLEKKQLNLRNTLFGPLLFGPRIINIDLRNASLINFVDEVFDISSISIFGTINDSGDCNEAESQDAAVVAAAAGEPAAIQASQTNGINIDLRGFRLINFGDEVFDISSISIFGDINDGACPPA